MKNGTHLRSLTAVILAGTLSCSIAAAQPEIQTVETKVGSLEYVGGYPTADTAQKLYDELDYQRAVQSYLWALPMASYGAMADAHYALGASHHAVLVADNSAEPQQLILTANQFDAMKRKEVYARNGPRMLVRFFGGWDFEAGDANNHLPGAVGYTKGVPMGGDLRAAPAGKAPTFLVAALRDPYSGNLDRIQVVKGWLAESGNTHEKVYDVIWADADKRQLGSDGKLPPTLEAELVCSGPFRPKARLLPLISFSTPNGNLAPGRPNMRSCSDSGLAGGCLPGGGTEKALLSSCYPPCVEQPPLLVISIKTVNFDSFPTSSDWQSCSSENQLFSTK